jgi:2-dehydropantoate 2-reductase
VGFIARGAHLQALRENGLKVRSVHGDFDIPHVFATDDPIEFGSTDLTICTIKSYDIGHRVVNPLISPQTTSSCER